MKTTFDKSSLFVIITLVFLITGTFVHGFLILFGNPLIKSHTQISFIISLLGIISASFVVYLLQKKLKNKMDIFHKSLEVSNKALIKQLYTDPLTSLGNLKALEEKVALMQNPKLIIVDIDDFRNINSYFGKAVGDEILLYCKETLNTLAKEWGMMLFRTGSDEFALLEDENMDIERYEDIASKIAKTFKGKELTFDGFENVELSATVGIALETEDIYEKALLALNEARMLQRDYLCYFKNIDKLSTYSKQLGWLNRIKEALQANSVIPYFQPIFDRDEKIVKYEALARIVHLDKEVFTPNLFVETSQKIRLYAQIEKMIIEKSLKMAQQTSNTISLNLLARDMADSDVSNFIVDRLLYYGVAKQVVIEILEDESIEHIDRIESFIARVKRMGVKIAIDDFGTGYSNFAYLLKLKPDYIKIDGSIIKNIAKDQNAHAIVGAIVVFAKELGVKTIAEFVHSKEVYEACFKLGVDEFQGYYLGEPKLEMIKG